MYRRCHCHLSFCSSKRVPTSLMIAGSFGKTPTTSVRLSMRASTASQGTTRLGDYYRRNRLDEYASHSLLSMVQSIILRFPQPFRPTERFSREDRLAKARTFRIVRGTTFFVQATILALFTSTHALGAEKPTTLASMCENAIARSPKLPVPPRDVYTLPHREIKTQHFIGAMRIYLTIYRCEKSDLFQGLNPVVEDAQQLKPFDIAMSYALAGSYEKSASAFRAILQKLPTFGDARNLLGVCYLAVGDVKTARAAWHDTLTLRYFTQPNDASGEPPALDEARYFLKNFPNS